MTELSRALLAAAREGLTPDAAIAARVRAKIAAATGVAAATGSVAALTVPKTSIAATLAKIAGALLVVGGVATVIVVAMPDRTPRPLQIELAPTEPADDIRTDVRVVAPSESPLTFQAMPQTAPHTQHGEPVVELPSDTTTAAALTGDATTHVSKPRRGSRAADEAYDSISLAREVELIDLAMVSLRKNVPHAALEAIKAYNRETAGRGQMAEDAAAIEIEARCLQDQDVGDLLARFDSKWPESAQRERIQTTCFAR